jgi:hypothetical protein
MTRKQIEKIIKKYDEKINYISENYDDYFEPSKETYEAWLFYNEMSELFKNKLKEELK